MSGTGDDSRALRAFAPALLLLVICAVINFVDRGNLSVAAPLLKDELHISASQLGILLSAFFWTYTAMQFVCGWLVDRFDVNRVIAAGFLLWSLATAATGLVRGFAMLLAMRLMLGIGESVMAATWSKIFSLHLPEYHRGFANGVVQAAVRSGPAVGTFGAGLLIAKYGWRPVFIGIGLISLTWLPAWKKWMPRGGAILRSVPASPGFADILRQRSFWGVCAGHFSVIYLLYFMLTWLPFYLVHERHLSMQSMAKIASAYYLIDALSSTTTGWLSDFFIRRGHTPTLVRKCAMAIGHMIAGVALANSHWYLVSLVAVGVGEGAAGSGAFCVFPDPCRPPCNWKMDRITKRFRKPLRCRGSGSNWISSGSDRKLSGTACDHCCGLGSWRPHVAVWGRTTGTSELEIRPSQRISSGPQHLRMWPPEGHTQYS